MIQFNEVLLLVIAIILLSIFFKLDRIEKRVNDVTDGKKRQEIMDKLNNAIEDIKGTV